MVETRYQEEKLRLQQKHDSTVQKVQTLWYFKVCYPCELCETLWVTLSSGLQILERKNQELEELKQHYRNKAKEQDECISKLTGRGRYCKSVPFANGAGSTFPFSLLAAVLLTVDFTCCPQFNSCKRSRLHCTRGRSDRWKKWRDVLRRMPLVNNWHCRNRFVIAWKLLQTRLHFLCKALCVYSLTPCIMAYIYMHFQVHMPKMQAVCALLFPRCKRLLLSWNRTSLICRSSIPAASRNFWMTPTRDFRRWKKNTHNSRAPQLVLVATFSKYENDASGWTNVTGEPQIFTSTLRTKCDQVFPVHNLMLGTCYVCSQQWFVS